MGLHSKMSANLQQIIQLEDELVSKPSFGEKLVPGPKLDCLGVPESDYLENRHDHPKAAKIAIPKKRTDSRT
jgi:hypothetical protein